MPASRAIEAARVALLFVAGLAIGLHYARMGFMPLDQSIVFDGGWRVLCGQVPFRDYTAPNGFTAHALQAVFFALCGVTWFAYCLHAAVINGLAAVLVDRLLVLLGLERWASSALALCTTIVFYPPFGVPYMDQHAFFFSLAALVAAIAAVRGGSERAQRRWALAAPALLLLAYLSKQIPSLFFVPAVLAVPLFAGACRWRLYRYLALGALVSLAVTLVAAHFAGVDWELLDTYWRRLPAEEGARRLGYVPSVPALLERFGETLAQWRMRSAWLAACLGTLSALVAVAVALRRRDSAWRAPLGSALAALFLLAASLLFVALTSNQKEIGLPLVFASLGAALAAVSSLAQLARPRFERVTWLARGFCAVFVVVAVGDAARFARDVVNPRSVNDIDFDAALAASAAAELQGELAYLRWSVPARVPYSPRDLRELAAYLRERPGAFYLLGDTGILYGLARKPSVSPSLWFHPGLTLPSPLQAEFERYESALLARVERHDVRTLVLEGEHAWIGYQVNPGQKPPKPGWIQLTAFPRLAQLVAQRTIGERAFGPFKAIELGP